MTNTITATRDEMIWAIEHCPDYLYPLSDATVNPRFAFQLATVEGLRDAYAYAVDYPQRQVAA